MGQRKGCLWITAGIITALIAGVTAFVVVFQATAQRPATPEIPMTEVVVARRSIAPRTVIDLEAIEMRSLPADSVPEGAVQSLEEANGKMAIVGLSPGEVLLSHRLADPTKAGANVAIVMDEDRVAVAFPVSDLMSRIGMLQPGDRVDILYSILMKQDEGSEGEQVTFAALQNVEVAAIIRPPAPEGSTQAQAPSALVFALDPQDALVLKYLEDAGGIVDLVVRSPTREQPFDTVPVHKDYLSDRYRIRLPQNP
ncbi:MAG: Flp pilus assembly protein CpaB [Chloroflexi bacterium]|nr:Flp pilus assembly protein CpaB [Chloroflexota bacterium]